MQRRVDKHFYQRTPDPVGVLARHGQALRTVSRRDDLERRLVLALAGSHPARPDVPVPPPRGPARVHRGTLSRSDRTRGVRRAAVPLAPRAAISSGPTVLAEVTMEVDEARTWEHLGIEALLPVRQGDEIPVVLGLGRKRSDDSWQERDMEILSSLAAQTSMALADIEARLHDASLKEAFDNQRALLPQQLPQPEAFSIAGAWHPALTVGGDYYDAWWLSTDAIAICVADVAGKGLAASLVMANLQATVKALAGPDVSPADLCTRVNETLAANLRKGRFVTFFYGVLRLSTGELRYANAGHNPPVLASGRVVHELGLGDPGLGLLRTHPYRDAVVRLGRGCAAAALHRWRHGGAESRRRGLRHGAVARPRGSPAHQRRRSCATTCSRRSPRGRRASSTTTSRCSRWSAARAPTRLFQTQKIRLPGLGDLGRGSRAAVP